MSSHTTHSHTTHFKKSHKDSGFTLIELLVVISIIALLSTIVLAVVQDARIKAKNTAKNSLALEYIKALELYRNDHNTYPVTENLNTVFCFGYSSSEKCLGDTSSGLDKLKTDLQAYLSGEFADKNSIQTSIGDLRGFTYICTGINSCESYKIEWILEKNITSCIEKSTETDNFAGTGHTYCSYTIN
jgi:prepilin-type N-terminal cleavage/methylation domain-containing protein